MLEPHKVAPPPRGVKHGVPSPGNDARRETSDLYNGVIVILASRWRVVAYRNSIQWILQKRTAEPVHEGIWRGQSYFTSREALLADCASRELLFDPRTPAVLEALPEWARYYRKN